MKNNFETQTVSARADAKINVVLGQFNELTTINEMVDRLALQVFDLEELRDCLLYDGKLFRQLYDDVRTARGELEAENKRLQERIAQLEDELYNDPCMTGDCDCCEFRNPGDPGFGDNN